MEPAKVLSKKELTRKLQDAGFLSTIVESIADTDAALIAGNVEFKQLTSGISTHFTDTIEKSAGKSTSELSACISINILMKGQVDFALSNHRYTLSATTNEPLLFINVIKEKQLFTRYFHQNVKIKKLNITVDKEWLLARCRNADDVTLTETIFAQQASVFKWLCNKEILSYAETLFNLNKHDCLVNQLQAEQLTLQIFNQCYQRLTDEKKFAVSPQQEQQSNPAFNAFEQEIEKLIDQKLSLVELSTKLGASISTLQRYCKAKHQCTLKEYIRNQKLEYARRAILFDNLSIGEASYYAGYSHVSNFVTAFKKYFSVTPSQLQKQYIK